MSCDTEIYLPTGEDFAVSYDFSVPMPSGLRGPLTVVDVIDVLEAGNCTGNYTVTRTMEIENCWTKRVPHLRDHSPRHHCSCVHVLPC